MYDLKAYGRDEFHIYPLVYSKDNLNKIQMRIDDIKFRIGLETFNKIETEFKNAQRTID